jgi:hypothetical protein
MRESLYRARFFSTVKGSMMTITVGTAYLPLIVLGGGNPPAPGAEQSAAPKTHPWQAVTSRGGTKSAPPDKPSATGVSPLNNLTLLNKIGSSLYKYSDPNVTEAAAELGSVQNRVAPGKQRDSLGMKQIIADIADFRKANPGARIVVFYTGAGVHADAAIDQLVKTQGFSTILAAPVPVDTNVNKEQWEWTNRYNTLEELKMQMQQDNGVLVPLGYKNYQDFKSKVDSAVKPSGDLFVSLEGTVIHGAIERRDADNRISFRKMKPVVDQILAAHAKGDKIAVLYLAESGDAAAFRKDFDSGDPRRLGPFREALLPLKGKVPVSFAGV